MTIRKSVSGNGYYEPAAIKAELDQIYNAKVNSLPKPETKPAVGRLSLMADAACDLISDKLDKDTAQTTTHAILTDWNANEVFGAINTLLDNNGVASEEALGIFPFVFIALKNTGGDPHDNFLEDLFEIRIFEWFMRCIEMEIEHLEPVDKLVELERRIYKSRHFNEVSYACYRGVLSSIKADVEKELELQKRRAENINATTISTLEPRIGVETQAEYDPQKRGLTRQLAMMLIDDLFPNLKDASNTSKAEFLELLTGYDSSGLRNKWSDYRRGNQASIGEDLKIVARWRSKLKIKNGK